MMHELDSLLCGIGGFIAGVMMCLALFCSQTWVMCVMACGITLLMFGLGLDRWRIVSRRW